MIVSEPSPRRSDSHRFDRLSKALWALAGIALPLIAFACAAHAGNWAADEPWQTSDFWVYATLLLKWPAVWPFYPLLLFSMVSLALFLWDRQRYATHFMVRLGLYGGVVLSLIFCWLIYAPTNHIVEAVGKTALLVCVILGTSQVALVVLALGVMIAAPWLRPRLKRWGWWGIAIRVLPIAVLLVGLSLYGVEEPLKSLLMPFAILLFVLLAASPAWAFAAYACAVASVLLQQGVRRRWNLMSLLGLSTWATCLFGAWRHAMDLAIREYATLPTENPNCFVCTAAAMGHRQFVHSDAIRVCGGRTLYVNDQLRILKAGELALMIVAPRTHRAVRRVYNAIGPKVARQLGSPWMADLAYLALKPAEWLAQIALRALGVRQADVRRIYPPQ
jgi:hypothetical protein